MLILTRKIGESITIGEQVKITVLGVFGRQVRLGVDAPPDVLVHREEVYVKIQEENREALKAKEDDLEKVILILEREGKMGETKPANIQFRKGRGSTGSPPGGGGKNGFSPGGRPGSGQPGSPPGGGFRPKYRGPGNY